LAAGIPQLVMPMAFDQFDNAARLRRLGVGLSLRVARFRGPAVAEALQDLLDSAEISARCREIAGRFRDTRPVDEACVAIETLAVPLASHSCA
jgi:UDP:flavonoid glycosyltransferase YjiC (YdhE family)